MFTFHVKKIEEAKRNGLISKTMEREKWIDIYRGVLIFLMVMGHAGSPFVFQIYIFHIPAFFFISGYAVSREKSIIKTLKQIILRIISCLTINIIFIVLNYVFCRWDITKIFFNQVGGSLFDQVLRLLSVGSANEFGGATWFLFALCITVFISRIIQIVGEKTYSVVEFILTIIVVIVGWFLSQSVPAFYCHCIDLGLLGVLYYQIGSLSRKFRLGERLDQFYYTIICMGVYLFLSMYWKVWQNWPTRSFGQPSITFLGSLAGIYLLCIVSKAIENTIIGSLFAKCGQHTYAVMCLHFVAFRVMSIILYMVGLCSAEEASTFPAINGYWCLYTFWAIAICYGLSLLAEKRKWTNYIINAKWRNK